MISGGRLAAWRKKDIAVLLGGTAFIFSCRIFGSGVTFVINILLARWIGAAGLGMYALAYSWLIMLAVIPASGYADASIRFIGQGLAHGDTGYARGFIRHSTRVVLATSVGIAITGIAVTQMIPGFSDELRTLFLLALAGVPFFALMRLNTGIANAASKFALSYLPNNVFRSLLFLAGISSVWLLRSELDARTVMAIHLVVMVIVALPMTIRTHSSIAQPPVPATAELESGLWFRTAFSFIALILFANYFQQITVIGAGFFLPSAEIGIYSVSYQIAMLISFGLIAIDAFAAPSLSRHFSKMERPELIRMIQHATHLRIAFSVLTVVLLAIFGKWILGVFGEEFVDGYMVLLILALAQVSYAVVGPVVRLLGISGHQKKGVYASIAALLLWIVLVAVLVPVFGLVGVALAVFLAWTTWSLTLRYLVRRYLGIDTLVIVRDKQR